MPQEGRHRETLENYRFKCFCDVCLDETTDTKNHYAKINNLLKEVNVPPEHESKRSTPWLFFGSAAELPTEYEMLGIEDKRLPRV
jgi:hypothetical protein